MPDFSGNLIKIYSRCDPDKVNCDDDYKKLVKEYGKNPFFNEKRHQIEVLRRHLDRRAGIAISAKAQVGEALRLYKQIIKGEDEMMAEACRELALQLYGGQWSEAQSKYFRDNCERLRTQKEEYFLSFTDNPDPDHEYRINRNHRYLIKSLLGHEAFKRADKKRDNLLARAIYFFLREHQIEGFYYKDKDRQGNAEKVEEMLREACEKALVFIQLVQNEMFVKVNGENWAYFEYKVARDTGHDPGKSSFLLAEGSQERLINRDDVAFQYLEWFDDVEELNKVILEFTEVYNTRKIIEVRKELGQQLVKRIEAAKDALFESAPS